LITVEGRAKINLTLDILGKRPDGYHEVAMVMQSIGLSDTITLEKSDKISLEIDEASLPADESNLAWKAARLILAEAGINEGIHIKINKRIPIAAGLAGGSTDAAAVLKGVNSLFALNYSDVKLCELGAKIGSDIPFCIMGGTMLSTGRGEVLERLPEFKKTYVVLAKPPIAVSTAWAYKNYDEAKDIAHPQNDLFIESLKDGDRDRAAGLLCNVLESVTIKKYEIIDEYKKMMLENGAMAAMMSGSGPTVFALVKDEETAQKIAAFMKQNTEAAVFVTETV